MLIKAYGHIRPVSDAFYEALDKVCADAIPYERVEPILRREGDMLHICFEGLHFPVEEVLDFLTRRLGQEHQGKLDVLDIEHWRLTRHIFDGGLHSSSAGLNSVLDYAGLNN
jgi:hypothetical protein